MFRNSSTGEGFASDDAPQYPGGGSSAKRADEPQNDPRDPGDEIRRLREENQRLDARQRELMKLIGCQNPEKLVHDMRNVLHELTLLRSLMQNDA